jgi:hypothetical protein
MPANLWGGRISRANRVRASSRGWMTNSAAPPRMVHWTMLAILARHQRLVGHETPVMVSIGDIVSSTNGWSRRKINGRIGSINAVGTALRIFAKFPLLDFLIIRFYLLLVIFILFCYYFFLSYLYFFYHRAPELQWVDTQPSKALPSISGILEYPSGEGAIRNCCNNFTVSNGDAIVLPKAIDFVNLYFLSLYCVYFSFLFCLFFFLYRKDLRTSGAELIEGSNDVIKAIHDKLKIAIVYFAFLCCCLFLSGEGTGIKSERDKAISLTEFVGKRKR